MCTVSSLSCLSHCHCCCHPLQLYTNNTTPDYHRHQSISHANVSISVLMMCCSMKTARKLQWYTRVNSSLILEPCRHGCVNLHTAIYCMLCVTAQEKPYLSLSSGNVIKSDLTPVYTAERTVIRSTPIFGALSHISYHYWAILCASLYASHPISARMSAIAWWVAYTGTQRHISAWLVNGHKHHVIVHDNEGEVKGQE